MTLFRTTAAGLALALMVGGAAMAGGDKTNTSGMSSNSGAATGKATDTAAASTKHQWTDAEKAKAKACMAMTADAMAADAECVRLKAAHDAKSSNSGAATAKPQY